MSLKAELEIWSQALEAYDAADLAQSLEVFATIAESSKVYFNIGVIHATLGQHKQAVQAFKNATELDRFFAAAYFQRGVSLFLIGEWDRARNQFEMSLTNMRGNDKIDYTQLGLPFSLFLPEIHFNAALCHIKRGDVTRGMYELRKASTRKITPAHEIIEEAIEKRGEGFTVYSIPVGLLFRPSENKLKNLAPKDYKGKAKLIAAASTDDEYTEFTGITRLGRKQTPSGSPMDAHQISRSKTLMRLGHSGKTQDGEEKTIKSFSTRDNSGEETEILGAEKNAAVRELGDLMDRRFSPSSTTETLLTPPPSSLPVSINENSKGKGGFVKRSNTLREFIRSPSFLSRNSDNSAKEKEKNRAPPIVTRGLDSLQRNSSQREIARSASDPAFVADDGSGARTAPVEGYRGQLQHGSRGLDIDSAQHEQHKEFSPLRPKRTDGRYNTSRELHVKQIYTPVQMQRSASALPSLETKVEAASPQFRSAPAGSGMESRPIALQKDDSSIYSRASGVTGRFPDGAVGPALIFQIDEPKATAGSKEKSRTEVRMTELYEGYYGLGDLNDEDEVGKVPVPPLPAAHFFKQGRDKRQPSPEPSTRPSAAVLMQNLEKLRIRQGEMQQSESDTRASPASSSQGSPTVTMPYVSPESTTRSLCSPYHLTPGGSAGEQKIQPAFRRSPLNSSTYDDEDTMGVDMQSIRIKLRYNDDIRALVISPQTKLNEFRSILCDKFDMSDDFRLRFSDEEKDQVSLKDEGDWEAALDCARYTAAGRPEGKLEVWVL